MRNTLSGFFLQSSSLCKKFQVLSGSSFLQKVCRELEFVFGRTGNDACKEVGFSCGYMWYEGQILQENGSREQFF